MDFLNFLWFSNGLGRNEWNTGEYDEEPYVLVSCSAQCQSLYSIFIRTLFDVRCSMFIQEKQMKLNGENLLLFFDGFAVLSRKWDFRWLQPQTFHLIKQLFCDANETNFKMFLNNYKYEIILCNIITLISSHRFTEIFESPQSVTKNKSQLIDLCISIEHWTSEFFSPRNFTSLLFKHVMRFTPTLPEHFIVYQEANWQ